METKFTETYPNVSEEGRETDCEKVVNLLDLIIDGEASSDEQTFFKAHIEDCVTCFESHQKQRLMKSLVSGHLKRVLVPASLASSIKAKIQQTA
ncbi:anti-sigma factor family protein [Botryobacter ruber]|uniref:anti-sigma factor family protein n=1 Tax=Botryobacter ruber TaxID=2171629 RepID=UPI000E0C2E19|nr:zf-HC2 domain-containing protein [Botryobacter ruber]